MSLLAYSFASGVMLIILAAAYMLSMRKTANFVLNRICLLSILTASLVIPFISFPSLGAANVAPIEVGELTLTTAGGNAAAPPLSFDVLKILRNVYLIGVATVALRYIANLIFIIYLWCISSRKTIGSLNVRIHNRKNIPPMSWGGEIFIEESLLRDDSEELEMILAHENAHRSQYHWLDLLLSNIVLSINWYNPAAWVMQIHRLPCGGGDGRIRGADEREGGPAGDEGQLLCQPQRAERRRPLFHRL